MFTPISEAVEEEATVEEVHETRPAECGQFLRFKLGSGKGRGGAL